MSLGFLHRDMLPTLIWSTCVDWCLHLGDGYDLRHPIWYFSWCDAYQWIWSFIHVIGSGYVIVLYFHVAYCKTTFRTISLRLHSCWKKKKLLSKKAVGNFGNWIYSFLYWFRLGKHVTLSYTLLILHFMICTILQVIKTNL